MAPSASLSVWHRSHSSDFAVTERRQRNNSWCRENLWRYYNGRIYSGEISVEQGSAASRHCSTELSAIDSSAVVMRRSFFRSSDRSPRRRLSDAFLLRRVFASDDRFQRSFRLVVCVCTRVVSLLIRREALILTRLDIITTICSSSSSIIIRSSRVHQLYGVVTRRDADAAYVTSERQRRRRRWCADNRSFHYRHTVNRALWNSIILNSIHWRTQSAVNTRSSPTAEISRVGGRYAVQGHSRSPILVPIESPCATSY